MTHNPMQFDVTKLLDRELGQMQRRAAKPNPFPPPNPRVRSTLGREGNLSGVISGVIVPAP